MESDLAPYMAIIEVELPRKAVMVVHLSPSREPGNVSEEDMDVRARHELKSLLRQQNATGLKARLYKLM